MFTIEVTVTDSCAQEWNTYSFVRSDLENAKNLAAKCTWNDFFSGKCSEARIIFHDKMGNKWVLLND